MKDNVCKYASLMRSLKHPNIVHMIGATTDPLCLITEFGELSCLSDIIRISPSKLTWSRIKTIGLEAARGMAFLHGQQPPFIHQNLTSNNIIVHQFFSVKICDPGLSGVLQESGEYKISPPKRWSAPEVLLGEAQSTKADVYVCIFCTFFFHFEIFNYLFFFLVIWYGYVSYDYPNSSFYS